MNRDQIFARAASLTDSQVNLLKGICVDDATLYLSQEDADSLVETNFGARFGLEDLLLVDEDFSIDEQIEMICAADDTASLVLAAHFIMRAGKTPSEAILSLIQQSRLSGSATAYAEFALQNAVSWFVNDSMSFG